eukprot:3293764-Prymnesium_polylepis.2
MTDESHEVLSSPGSMMKGVTLKKQRDVCQALVALHNVEEVAVRLTSHIRQARHAPPFWQADLRTFVVDRDGKIRAFVVQLSY